MISPVTYIKDCNTYAQNLVHSPATASDHHLSAVQSPLDALLNEVGSMRGSARDELRIQRLVWTGVAGDERDVLKTFCWTELSFEIVNEMEEVIIEDR